jgi:hypothetical protein
MFVNLKKIKAFLVIILFSMVTDVDSAVLEADNLRQKKEKFYDQLDRLLLERTENELLNPDRKTKKTYTYIKLNEYQTMIDVIEAAKSKTTKKTSNEYNLLRDYEIMYIGETKKIVKKRGEDSDPIRFLVPYEHIFETLNRIHQQVGHKCRDVMLPACKKNHLNLTVDAINSKF